MDLNLILLNYLKVAKYNKEKLINKKIAVVGGGIGGICVASLLAHKGFMVDLFEQNEYLGGKAGEIKINNFRFDTGPSILTLLENLEEFFDLCGEDMNEYLTIYPLRILSRNFFEDRKIINIYSDPNLTAEELCKKANVKKSRFFRYLKNIKFLSNLFLNFYSKGLFSKTSNLTDLRFVLRVIFNLVKIPLFTKFIQYLNKFFGQNYYIERIFGRFVTYVGSDPYQSSAILHIIADAELNKGGFYVEGGIYSIVKAIQNIGEKNGVNFYLNSKVLKVLDENESKVLKVSKKVNQFLEEHEYKYDIVISNLDYVLTNTKLLNQKVTPILEDQKHLSSSVIVFLIGIEGITKEMDIHNVFFSDDYKKEFDEIFNKQTIPTDPTVYVNITSKYCSEDAPNGNENWFTLVNVPPKTKLNNREINSLLNKIILKIEKFIPNIKSRILFFEVLDPQFYEIQTGSYMGSLYGLNTNYFKHFFLRPGNRDKKIKGLYYVGGSVSPGGGIPNVVRSAINCYKEIISDYKI